MIPQIQDYIGMIEQIAYRKHSKFGIEIEELEGKGRLLFVEALVRFDPTKNTKFSTFFYMVLEREMVVWERGYAKDYAPVSDTDMVERAIGGFAPPHVSVEFFSDIESLSAEAKKVIKMVLKNPEEVVSDAIGRSKLMAGNVRKMLIERGWKTWKINECFLEIRKALA